MLERINNDLNIDAAILYANNKMDRNEEISSYEESSQNEEYILLKDPIRRIADINY